MKDTRTAKMKPAEYLRYKNLEQYLFTDVNRRFHREKSLGAFDLFSIVIWKANRAKSVVAKRLMKKARKGEDLEAVARRLTRKLHELDDANRRLVHLRCEWELGLPMSSAILAVCYPDDFSVYDYRVCEELDDFTHLANRKEEVSLCSGYEGFLAAVRQAAPKGLSLRDCDRFLWARSAAEQLERDISNQFRRPKKKSPHPTSR